VTLGGGSRPGGISTTAGALTSSGRTTTSAQSTALGSQVIRLPSSGSSLTLAGSGTTRSTQLGVSTPECTLASAVAVTSKGLGSPRTSHP
jgi:hypothetical protein